MEQYAFSIQFCDEESDFSLLIGRCIKQLHGYQCQHQINSIGVFFPEWNNRSPGKYIAFISRDLQQLKRLSKLSYFIEMQSLEKFKVSHLSQLPDNFPQVHYMREHKKDKRTAAGRARVIKRLEKRAQGRGEEYIPKQPLSKKNTLFFNHSIPLTSKAKNTSQDALLDNYYFRIYLARIEPSEEESKVVNTFNSHGLSNKVQHTSCVPAPGLNPFFTTN